MIRQRIRHLLVLRQVFKRFLQVLGHDGEDLADFHDFSLKGDDMFLQVLLVVRLGDSGVAEFAYNHLVGTIMHGRYKDATIGTPLVTMLLNDVVLIHTFRYSLSAYRARQILGTLRHVPVALQKWKVRGLALAAIDQSVFTLGRDVTIQIQLRTREGTLLVNAPMIITRV